MNFIRENSFGLILPSHDTRPTINAGLGAVITPAQNTYGSWATVMAAGSVTDDAYMIDVIINNVGFSAEARDSLTDIGVDPSGGTTPTVLIPTLMSSYASVYAQNGIAGGWRYRFRLKIKAGSTIMARGMVNNATVRTQNVFIVLYCRPSRTELCKVGSYVVAFGADVTASCGTAITSGTVSAGSYTQLGTAIADLPLWDWSVALSPKNLAIMSTGAVVHTDLAIGSSTSVNRRVVANQVGFGSTAEMWHSNVVQAHSPAAVGDLVFARGWSGDSTTAHSAIAYGVGG